MAPVMADERLYRVAAAVERVLGADKLLDPFAIGQS
jgi:hypothetical protein